MAKGTSKRRPRVRGEALGALVADLYNGTLAEVASRNNVALSTVSRLRKVTARPAAPAQAASNGHAERHAPSNGVTTTRAMIDLEVNLAAVTAERDALRKAVNKLTA